VIKPGAENISCELRISRVNIDMLMDLRQRKEKAENEEGGSGEMAKVEKRGK